METSRRGCFFYGQMKEKIKGEDEIKYEEHTGADGRNMVKWNGKEPCEVRKTLVHHRVGKVSVWIFNLAILLN